MHDIIRAAPAMGLALFLLLSAGSSSAGSDLPISSALLRVPQATVNGTGLQQFFTAVGESIVPSRDQLDVGLLSSSVTGNTTFVQVVELVTDANGVSSGFYDGYELHPTLIQLFPATATARWFALISYPVAPTRLVVNVYDASASLVGSTTYPGVDSHGIGVYMHGAGGTLYSDDTRNPGDAPQLLFFSGTGTYSGGAWLTAEAQPLANGSDADYDDVAWHFDAGIVCIFCDPPRLTPVRHANWGELKARFQ
jgi:hypothetical protein